MKNLFTKIFFVAMLLSGVQVKAQYFHHVYGTPGFDHLFSGVNTTILGNGHFMTGISDNPIIPQRMVAAVRADINGDASVAPYFNNNYLITTLSNVPLHVREAKGVELSTGDFGIVCVCDDGANSFLVYLRLDASGTPLVVQKHRITNWDIGLLGALAKSLAGTEIYVTGSATDVPNNNTCVFAMKIDALGGNLMWTPGVYDILQPGTANLEIGHTIIESPYNTELLIAGGVYEGSYPSAPIANGFILRIGSGTGNLISTSANLYGSATSDDVFRSITVASSGAGGTNGFVLGGQSDFAGNTDFWMMKTNTIGNNTVFSKLYDYSLSPGIDNACFSVIERYNTIASIPKYEYYMGGTIAGISSSGAGNIQVIKTDDLGNGLPNGEFTYGTTGEVCWQLDQNNSSTGTGLSIYGSEFSGTNGFGSSDFYLIKSYFDGNSGCFEQFSTPIVSAGLDYMGDYFIQDYFPGSVSNPLFAFGYSFTDVKLCYTSSIPGASNARMAPVEPRADKQATIIPNPMATGAQAATVEIAAETPVVVDITVHDMLGKQYYKGSFDLNKGKNQLPLDISNANMAAGMYTVKISGNSIHKTILLIVK